MEIEPRRAIRDSSSRSSNQGLTDGQMVCWYDHDGKVRTLKILRTEDSSGPRYGVVSGEDVLLLPASLTERELVGMSPQEILDLPRSPIDVVGLADAILLAPL